MKFQSMSVLVAGLLLLSVNAMAARDLADTDSDGLPDTWESLFVGSTTGMDPAGDIDSDGLNNLVEYQRFLDYADPEKWQDGRNEAKTRISAVITGLDTYQSVKDNGFRAGSNYFIEWETLGYSNIGESWVVLFDCTGVAAGKCGDKYDDTAFLTVKATPATTAESAWTFTPSDDTQPIVHALDQTFRAEFTVPATRSDGSNWLTEADNNGTAVVVRWYKREDDVSSQFNSISILLGTEAGRHYGDNVRRVSTTVSTDAAYYEN